MSIWQRGAAVVVVVAVFAGALTGTAVAGTPPSAPVSDSAAMTTAAPRSAKAVVRYWTTERMRSAIPIETTLRGAGGASRMAQSEHGAAGKVDAAAPLALVQSGGSRAAAGLPGAASKEWPGSFTSPPGATSGKVFFTGDDGVNYECSGSTVNSGGKNVVFTAGHCVHGGGPGRRYFTNWVFVPGYRDHVRPFGTWTARQLWTLNGWAASGDRTYDIGAVVMNAGAFGRHIVDTVGGQGIEWNFPLEQFVYQFGYPRFPELFNGELLRYCTGSTFNDGGHEGIQCNMTEGASGGPWLDDFDGTFGRLVSVNSWVFWDGNGVRYKWNGPYFGNGARDLYNAVANL